MPIFQTPCLQLRPLGEADEALYCRLHTDPEVMRHIAAPLTPGAARTAFQHATRLMQQQVPTLRLWVVHERAPRMDIGILALIRQDDTGDTAEIGTMLVAAGQGRGLAAEAQTVLLDHLFAVPGVRLVSSRHAPGHGAVIGVKLKLGFVRTEVGDVDDPEVRWQMTRQRWNARRLVAGNGKA